MEGGIVELGWRRAENMMREREERVGWLVDGGGGRVAVKNQPFAA